MVACWLVAVACLGIVYAWPKTNSMCEYLVWVVGVGQMAPVAWMVCGNVWPQAAWFICVVWCTAPTAASHSAVFVTLHVCVCACVRVCVCVCVCALPHALVHSIEVKCVQMFVCGCAR